MEGLIILLGTVLFLILLGTMIFLILNFDALPTVGIIVMSIIMVVAIGAVVFMAITSIFSTYTNSMNRQPTTIEIMNISLCDNPNMPCYFSAFPDNNNVTVFWQVRNGVGCCATYNCNYTRFAEACLSPFKLYDIYMDDTKHDWSDFNMTEYDYNCSYVVPWNYFYFNNVSIGIHTISIEQKDCGNNILATANISFNLSQLNDIYILEVIR